MPLVLSLYLALTSVAEPAARRVLRRRLAAGKEDAGRLGERLGAPSRERPEGVLAWFHAASVGEGLSLLPLIDGLRAARPDVAVLVTSGTVTSAGLLAERLPAGAVHQYVPVDIGPPVQRFLDHWRPDLAVWTESEIWPRLLWSVGERGVPALLLNARLSETSRRRWQRIATTAASLFSVFDYVQAQDAATARALQALGVRRDRLHLTGSFKESAAPLPCDGAELRRLAAAVSGRPVWVAASTHPGEEEFVLGAHDEVLRAHRDALLILVPRHPERGSDVASLIGARGFSWSRRDEGPPAGDAQVYLADTLGEMGLWYRLADAAFVGGSLGGVGGHNPYEPAILDVPVVHGPDASNFAEVYDALDAGGGAVRVERPGELADAVKRLVGAEGSGMAARARRIIGGGSGALERALEAILARLPAARGA